MDAILWLIVIVGCIVVEILTLGLTSIWFAGGALVAFVAALLSAPIWLQIVLFMGAAALMLVFTRPWARTYINQSTVKTNYESMEGRIGEVTEPIDNLKGTGCVRIAGQDWTARTAEGIGNIPAGSKVTVERIEGVKVIVTPIVEEEKE